MAIVRYPTRSVTYSPWRELDEVTNRLARMFDETGARSYNGTTVWAPQVNVAETADELVFTAELPGMSRDQVNIELEQNVLTISGEKVEERTEGEEERKYHLWERTFGSFRRAFTLPRPVNAEDVTARFENGILEIRLPKAPEAKGRKIEISKR
jgi:HSP20 family protein